MKKVLSAILIMLSLSAVAQSSGSKWKVVYVWEGLKMENISTKKAEVLLEIGTKKISGNAGCNKFHGNLKYVKGDKIKPIKLVNEKENCPKDPDRLTESVLVALKTADRLVINLDKAKFYRGDKLVLEMNR